MAKFRGKFKDLPDSYLDIKVYPTGSDGWITFASVEMIYLLDFRKLLHVDVELLLVQYPGRQPYFEFLPVIADVGGYGWLVAIFSGYRQRIRFA